MSPRTPKNRSYANAYRDFPELYDLLYQRYLKTVPDFVRLVERYTPPGGKILDLAAGTGSVSVPLLKHGYRVTSLDGSAGMLRALRAKARAAGVTPRTTVQDLNQIVMSDAFDVVCIRQAINYYDGTAKLAAGLRRIRTKLKDGGTFVFNAPNHDHRTKAYPPVECRYADGDRQAFVLETNVLTGRTISHRQHAIVWEPAREPLQLEDENSFYLFTKAEFERCLKRAGFRTGVVTARGASLYGVAER